MSSDDIKNELDRRAFMKRLLLGTGVVSSLPIDLFLSNMMISMFQRAHALAAGMENEAFSDMKYISFVMANGAPRYYWDLPIRPNGDDYYVPNPMVISRFTGSGSSVKGEYATTNVGGYHMPTIWDANIATPNGTAPMRALSENMLILRGLDLQIDSHDIDRFRQVAPVPGGISLSGLAADQAKTPIPAIGNASGGGSYFRSEKGIAYQPLSGTNPFTAAMAPFSQNSGMLSLSSPQVEKAIDDALKRMEAASGGKNKFLPSTYVARINAKKMMMKQFGNLQSAYTQLNAKYLSLINRAFDATGSLSLAGVDSLQIPGGQTALQRLTQAEYVIGSDLRTLTDMNTRIDSLAEGMAIAEFMITQGLSSSVNIQAGNFINIFGTQLLNSTSKAVINNSRRTHSVDVHFTGAHAGLVLFSRYYRALSSCLYEFTNQLKATPSSRGNLFNQSIVTVTSEFNRSARADGDGADHGWQGSNFTILSGMIDQFAVRGNIKTTETGAYKGTWGLAAGVSELNGREAIIGNAASTIASLMEVKSPTPNDMPFAYKQNGKAVLSVKSCKNMNKGEAA